MMVYEVIFKKIIKTSLFVQLKMSKKLIIKYFLNNEFAKQSFHGSEDAAGYDVLAAESKTLLLQSCNSVELE